MRRISRLSSRVRRLSSGVEGAEGRDGVAGITIGIKSSREGRGGFSVEKRHFYVL